MLTQQQGLFLMLSCQGQSKLGEDTAGTADPNWKQHSFLFDVVLNKKSWQKKYKAWMGEGEMVRVADLTSQVTVRRDETLFSQKQLDIFLPKGSSDCIPCLSI